MVSIYRHSCEIGNVHHQQNWRNKRQLIIFSIHRQSFRCLSFAESAVSVTDEMRSQQTAIVSHTRNVLTNNIVKSNHNFISILQMQSKFIDIIIYRILLPIFRLICRPIICRKMNKNSSVTSSTSKQQQQSSVGSTTTSAATTTAAIRKVIGEKYLKSASQQPPVDSCFAIMNVSSAPSTLTTTDIQLDEDDDFSGLSEQEIKALKRQRELDEKYGG